MQNTNPAVAIYGCGDAGCGITATGEKDAGTDFNTGFYYINTTASSLAQYPQERAFWTGNRQNTEAGSGKVMKHHFAAIADDINQGRLFDTCPAGSRLNIIVCGLGGGSGVAAMQALVDYFHKKDLPVIIMAAIDMTGDQQDAGNGAKAINNLMNIGARHHSTATIATFLVNENTSYAAAKKDMGAALLDLFFAFATDRVEPDTTDIDFWIKTSWRVSGIRAQFPLTMLMFHRDADSTKPVKDRDQAVPISSLVFLQDDEQTVPSSAGIRWSKKIIDSGLPHKVLRLTCSGNAIAMLQQELAATANEERSATSKVSVATVDTAGVSGDHFGDFIL